jgi:hypothetical protein
MVEEFYSILQELEQSVACPPTPAAVIVARQ